MIRRLLLAIVLAFAGVNAASAAFAIFQVNGSGGRGGMTLNAPGITYPNSTVWSSANVLYVANACPSGAAVGTATETPTGGSFTGTFSLSGTDAASFSVNSSTGAITCASTLSPRYYSFNVVATQSGASNSPAPQAVSASVGNEFYPAVSYTCSVNYYVDPINGSDSNAGTAAGAGHAWQHIAHAESTLSGQTNGGTCINAAPGTYSEAPVITAGGSTFASTGMAVLRCSTSPGTAGPFLYAITNGVQGARPSCFIVAPTGNGAAVTFQASWALIDGFDVTTAGEDASNGPEGVGLDGFCSSGQPNFSSCDGIGGYHHIGVLNSYIHDVGGGGIEMARGDSWFVQGNDIARTSATKDLQESGVSFCCGNFSAISNLQTIFAGALDNTFGTVNGLFIHNLITNNASHDNVIGASVNNFQATGYILGTVMTITAVASGTISVNQTVCGAAPGVVINNTSVSSDGSGTGGPGTYNVNGSQTVGSSGSPVTLYGCNHTDGEGIIEDSNNTDNNSSCINDLVQAGTLVYGNVLWGNGGPAMLALVSGNTAWLNNTASNDNLDWFNTGTLRSEILVNCGSWNYIGYNAVLANPGAGILASNIATTINASTNEYASSSSATIAGTTLTVGGTLSGSFAPFETVTQTSGVNAIAGIAANTLITANGSGTGGAGTYTLSVSQTVSSAVPIAASTNNVTGNVSGAASTPVSCFSGGSGANCYQLPDFISQVTNTFANPQFTNPTGSPPNLAPASGSNLLNASAAAVTALGGPTVSTSDVGAW